MEELRIQTSHIAVVGNPEIISAFRAAGLAVFPVQAEPDAGKQVQRLVDEGYRVIFFTEELSRYLEPVLERARRTAVPCIVALPTGAGKGGITRLKAIVRRAVGADIFGPRER